MFKHVLRSPFYSIFALHLHFETEYNYENKMPDLNYATIFNLLTYAITPLVFPRKREELGIF